MQPRTAYHLSTLSSLNIDAVGGDKAGFAALGRKIYHKRQIKTSINTASKGGCQGDFRKRNNEYRIANDELRSKRQVIRETGNGCQGNGESGDRGRGATKTGNNENIVIYLLWRISRYGLITFVGSILAPLESTSQTN